MGYNFKSHLDMNISVQAMFVYILMLVQFSFDRVRLFFLLAIRLFLAPKTQIIFHQKSGIFTIWHWKNTGLFKI